MIAKDVAKSREDSAMEDVLGMGNNAPRGKPLVGMNRAYLSQVDLENLYLDGFGKIIVDKPAEEMTRAGIILDDIEPEQNEKIMARIEEMNILHHFAEAIKNAKYCGGALMVLGIVDGASDLAAPLNEDRVQSLSFIRVYDRYEVTVKTKYSDPSSEKYGQVEVWTINSASGNKPYDVHASRTLIFDGEFVPNAVRSNNDGWGYSILQKCHRELLDLISAHKNASHLLKRSQQAVYRMKGLANTLSEEGDVGKDKVMRRIGLVDASASIYNAVVIDMEEEYNITSQSMAGVNELLDRKAEALAAVSDVPVFLLFGRSPGGLNSTGEANREGWNAKVGAMQKDLLFHPMDKIVTILFKEQGASEEDIRNYKLSFAPLSVPSDKVQADTDLVKAQKDKAEMETFQGYINAGVVDPSEAREQIAERYEIDPNDVPEPPEPEPIMPSQAAAKKTTKK